MPFAGIQACLQTRVAHSSDADRELQSYFRMTFHL